MLHEDREVAGLALPDRFELGLGFGRLGVTAGPVELLRERVAGPQMVRIPLHHLPEPADGVLEAPLEPRELGLQKTDLGAVGGEAEGRLDVPGRLGLVAEPDVHHRQVGPNRGLVRGQRRRPLELRLRIVEQPYLQGREPPVERAHRLAVLGRYLRRDARGHPPASGQTQRERSAARRQLPRCRHSHHRAVRSSGRRHAASSKAMPQRQDNRDARGDGGNGPAAGGMREAARGGTDHTSPSSASRPVLSPTRSAGTSSLPSSDR